MDIVTLGAALNGSAEYVNSHFVGGSNIQIVDNQDGTQTINASGEVSSEDTVARAEIAEMKDGTNIDSFGDVETALATKANVDNVYKLALSNADLLPVNTDLDNVKTVGCYYVFDSATVVTITNKPTNNTSAFRLTVEFAAGEKRARQIYQEFNSFDKYIRWENSSNVYSAWKKVECDLSTKQGTISDLSTIRSGAALGATAVQPETGKGLSTNDYTTAEKTKLAGIAEGAEVNEIEGIKVNSSTINPDANKVVNITVPTTATDVSALPDTTKYAAALSLTINSSTYVMTGQLKDQNGDNLGTAQTIDLPLESVVVGGSYNSQTKKVVLTLQNGNAIEFSVADLVSGLQTELSTSNKLNPAYIDYDSTHRAVSDTEKSTWNGKQNALNSTQLDAVNSGIDSTKVEQIETNKNNILSIQQEQIVQNNEIATLREITNCKLYGYRIDKQDTNPDTRVTYLYDAVGMTPAYMDFSGGSFNYGSWADIWFIKNNRPVALKFDGTVDYELSHTDFTKKIDGETASDVEDVNYAGNFMSEIPLVYVKRWEDTRYNYVVFSETKPNDDYLAQAHTGANGTVNPYIYLPMFKGWKDSGNKLRSLMGTYPTGNTTGANEVTYASNCGTGWQLWDKAKIDLVMDLIVLITKSTNCRTKIGNGDCTTYNASDTTNYGKMKSGYETDGTTRSANAQFYSSEGTEVTNYGKHHMIAFYIEDLWGNRWDRCLGFNLVDNVYKVKMTPPYVLDSDSTYQSLSVTPPSSTEGWLKNVSSGVYGDVPTEVGASNTSGFANYFYKNASGNRLSLFGGHANFGRGVGRCWRLDHDSGFSSWDLGGSPCYTAL